MKSLLLLRHAKSSWDDPALDDFDRPLARRGIAAAPKVGREIARRGWFPDFALVSAAARTRETFALVEHAIGLALPHAFDRSIYEAPAGHILDAIRRTPPETRTLLVIGHNPGFEDLSRRLAAPDSDRASMAMLNDKFPTAALARFTFEDEWAALTDNAAVLTDFVRPRDLP